MRERVEPSREGPPSRPRDGPERRVRITSGTTLYEGWRTARRYRAEYRRSDGRTQTVDREVCFGGDRAVVLLHDRRAGTVILTRQLRLPVLTAAHQEDPFLIEAPGGRLDGDSPSAAIRREVEEETGVVVTALTPLLAAYMSPDILADRTHFFRGEFESGARGEVPNRALDEGEDIDVLEVPLSKALSMVQQGEIVDGRTILLLLHARLREEAPPFAHQEGLSIPDDV